MYIVTVNGMPIQCETAEQAIELARQAGGEGTSVTAGRTPRNGTESQNSRWTERRVRDLFAALSPAQRKLIDTLLGSPDARTDRQLRTALGLTSKSALGGVFSGVVRNTKKVGASPNDLYTTKSVQIDDEMSNEYELTESFRTAAQRVIV